MVKKQMKQENNDKDVVDTNLDKNNSINDKKDDLIIKEHNEIPILSFTYSSCDGSSCELMSKGFNMKEAIDGMKYLLEELQKEKIKQSKKLS